MSRLRLPFSTRIPHMREGNPTMASAIRSLGGVACILPRLPARQILCGLAILCALSTASAQDVRVAAHARFTMEQENDVVALAFSSNGRYVLAGDDDGGIQCWDIARKTPVVTTSLDAGVLFLAFLSGDQSFVAVDTRGTVLLYDMLKGASGLSFSTKGTPIRATVDAGKQYLAVATRDERIEMFDLKASVPAGTIDGRDKLEDVLFIGFDRLGEQLVAVMQYGDVVAWNPATLKPLRNLTLAGGELHGGRTVVYAATTNRATNVFAVSLEEVALPKGGIHSGRDLERRSMIIAYDWASGAEVKRVKTETPVERMAMGPGNDHLVVSGDDDPLLTLVDLRKGETGSSVTAGSRPTALAVSDDNRWCAAGGADGEVSVWSMEYKGDVTTSRPGLPSLSGRIRARGSAEPALPPGVAVKLAILSFESRGVSSEIADVALSSLSNGLANVDYVTLVERKQIETILKEQQFQLSGLTEEEGVSVGRLLKADVILLGNVGKLGTSIIFSARLISVETGKVLKGREVVCEECRDQDLYDAITMLVSTIAQ